MMKKSLICFVVPALMILSALLFSTDDAAWSADSAAAIDALSAKMAKMEHAQYTLLGRSRIKGKLRPFEKVMVKTSDGAFYYKWVEKNRKGRELIYRPDWNGGKAWVKEGGVLEFCAVSIGLNDAILKADYNQPMNGFLIAEFAKRILKWKKDAASVDSSDGVFVMKDQTGRTMEVTLDKSGYPKKLLVKDKSGKMTESYEIYNLKTGMKFDEKAFDPSNPAYGFPGYSESGFFIDPDKLKANLIKKWSTIKDYSCLLTKRELVKGKMTPKNYMSIKFRKPMDIYATWIKEPHKGRQVIYRGPDDDKMLVKESGILGIKPLRIGLDSSLAKGDTNHRLTELDIGFAIKTIYENLNKGMKNGDAKIKFIGMEYVGGRRAYTVLSEFSNTEQNGYYAAKSRITHDVATGIPIKILNYNSSGQMFEEMVWTRLKFNVGHDDMDFSKENPEYGF